MVIVTALPTCSALFPAAASVSKARCRVDAEAALQAASTLACEYDDGQGGGPKNPLLRPFTVVWELVRLSTTYSFVRPLRYRLSTWTGWKVLRRGWKWLRKNWKLDLVSKRQNKDDKEVTRIDVP